MAKTKIIQSTTIITTFKAQREALTTRLAALYKDERRIDEEKLRIDEEKRLIEDALAVEPPNNGASNDSPRRTRVSTPRAARTSKGNGKAKGGKPSGAIMPAIWDYLVKHQGAESGDIRKNIRIQGKSLLKLAGSEAKAKMSCGTALNAMKKTGRLIVKGKRGHYRYFVSPPRA